MQPRHVRAAQTKVLRKRGTSARRLVYASFLKMKYHPHVMRLEMRAPCENEKSLIRDPIY